ncbi:MAG: PA0069 family radical SAM protein [Pseudomonadota bacterium]
MSPPSAPPRFIKGRGAVSDRDGRFAKQTVDLCPEEAEARQDSAPASVYTAMQAGKIIASNSSPDVPFNRSINPYQGCEHGCIYCYARPSHSYLDLSPGLDFESRIFYKPNAAERLEAAWSHPGYQCEPITIGANTDPYQPLEKVQKITRQLLQLFLKHRHPVNLITKGTLIQRDIDLLAALAERRLCSVALSLPTLDSELKRLMEPRVPSAQSRLKLMASLTAAGIPVSTLLAPLIPAINDHEIEAVLEAVAAHGATQAHYVFLRLPHEVRPLFTEWLETHFPDRAGHVMSLVRQAGGGKDYNSAFGVRQRGRGAYADMLARRFETAARRHGLTRNRYQQRLDCAQFQPPGQRQLGLDF